MSPASRPGKVQSSDVTFRDKCDFVGVVNPPSCAARRTYQSSDDACVVMVNCGPTDPSSHQPSIYPVAKKKLPLCWWFADFHKVFHIVRITFPHNFKKSIFDVRNKDAAARTRLRKLQQNDHGERFAGRNLLAGRRPSTSSTPSGYHHYDNQTHLVSFDPLHYFVFRITSAFFQRDRKSLLQQGFWLSKISIERREPARRKRAINRLNNGSPAVWLETGSQAA